MSFVAVQTPASSHGLGRGHPHPHPHHAHHHHHHHAHHHHPPHGNMVDMARPQSSWMHEPYAQRYFSSPPDHHSSPHHHHNQQTPPSSHALRLPPASSLVSPHHPSSPHSHHLPPPPPPPPTSHGPSREPPFPLKTHYQYADAYGTPSPVGSAPSPQLHSGTSRPVAPTSDASYSPAPRRTVGDIRQLSPTHSSSSSSADEEGRLRQFQQQQLAKAAIQQHERGQAKEGPMAGLALITRHLPPPAAHALTSPASSRWSPIRQEGKVKIADLLLNDGPSDSQHPQPPTGMPTPLSAPAVPSANSRPPSARAHRIMSSPAAILQPGQGSYSISVRQQPVAARSCGFGERDRRVIDPPPIVQLTINDSGISPEEVARMIRHPFAVVHCSIWDQTGNQDNSAMPEDYRQQRRLMGTLVASPFVGLDENGEEGCFFCFPDLSCRTPGAFRLKFSLVVINPSEMVPGTRSPIRATAMSEVFTVYNAKDFPGMQASTPLTKKLKEQGCLISIKKGNEKTPRGRDDSEEDDEDDGGRKKRTRKN